MLDRRTFGGMLAATVAVPVAAQEGRKRTLALLFDSMVSPFWQASIRKMRSMAAQRGWSVLEAVSNLDDNRQYQQVQSMIQRRVDGIIIVHTDNKAVIPAIRAANAAGVPLVHFNRPPAENDAYSVAVVADNRKLMRETVLALLDKARSRGGQYQCAFLVGDLGDANAVQRHAGFLDAVGSNRDLVEVVASIATEWNADKAYAGLVNALQANPGINMVVSSSDFLTPQIEQALRAAGKWQKAGEPGHVLIGSLDGDEGAYAQLAAGYYDVDGVQDLDRQVQLAFGALEQMWAGGKPARALVDPGVVVDQENLQSQRGRMWGYEIWKTKHSAVASAPPPGTAAVGSSSAAAAASNWSAVGFFAALLLLTQMLGSADTWRDVAFAMMPLAILVAGQALVMLTGQIDLSMTAVMSLSSVIGASVMTGAAADWGDGAATAAGIAASLAVGSIVGLFNGVCHVWLRIPSFIVTLAVMMAGGGAALWFVSATTDASSIGGLPQAFRDIGYGSVLRVPISLLLSACVLAACHYVLSKTVPGRWVYAIGHNREVARISGVPVGRVSVSVFMASGLCAALASVVYTSRIETGLPTLGQNQLLDVVGAAVIGGVSLFGGRGSVLLALGGVLFLCLLDKSLQFLGLSLFLVLALKGVAILAAVMVDAARKRRRGQP